MQIEIHFTQSPIAEPPASSARTIGAVLEFRGLIRDREGESEIQGLDYEIYESMARSEIRRILEELAVNHPCSSVLVIHRWGRVPIGEAAIFVRVESAHRGEGVRLLEEFMNRLKSEVPIWKVGTW